MPRARSRYKHKHKYPRHHATNQTFQPLKIEIHTVKYGTAFLLFIIVAAVCLVPGGGNA